MLVHVPLRGLGATEDTAHFQDVPLDHPFRPFIERIWKAGITTGCSSDPPKFCPDETVTRGQLAVFLSRAMDAGAGGGGAVPNTAPLTDGNPADGFSIGGYKVSKLAALGGLLVLVALLRR